MEHFGVGMAAIDHLPEGRLAHAFAERFPGRVYLVAYNTAEHPRGPDTPNVKPDERFATVRRLEAIDKMTDLIRAQCNLLPLDLPDEYFDHLQALVRTSEQDEFGKQRVFYRAIGDDDYAQAEVYDVLATELWLHQQYVAHAMREEFTTLEEHIDFRRSDLASYDEDFEYSPGPPEPDLDDFDGY